MNRQLDIEDLIAWMDGELSGDDARRVARLVETDPHWQADFKQFRAVDHLTGLIEPARPGRDLTDRIVRSAHQSGRQVYRRRRLVRVVKIVAPLAAAACIILALWFGGPAPKPKTEGQPPAVGVTAEIAAILKDVPQADRFIVQNLPLFRNYQKVTQYQQVCDLADAETLSALTEMENEEM